jgi:hypothetical protein
LTALVKSSPTLAKVVYVTDIKGLGLPVARGLTFSSAFYWDQNDAARAFATALVKSSPTLAKATTSAPELWAWSRKDE